MRTLVTLLLATLPLVAAPVPKAVKKSLQLDGVWEVVEVRSDGQPPTPHEARWTINGEAVNYQTLTNGEPTPGPSDATMGLVHAKGEGANAFDYVVTYHTGRVNRFPGVVEVDGDTLKVCYSIATPKVRPTECRCVAGTVMFVFKRKETK